LVDVIPNVGVRWTAAEEKNSSHILLIMADQPIYFSRFTAASFEVDFVTSPADFFT
jgi:hypothetical protein